MKRIILSVIIVITTLSTFAQEPQETLKNNELKINMSNLIGFKFLDVGYEKILNEESAFGVNVLFNIDKSDANDDSGLDEYRTFSITPYYRHFFSNKYASGFFVEIFTMLHSGEEDLIVGYADFPPYTDIYNTEKYTDFAVGISAGAKFVSKRGFVAEVYLGIGRDLLNNHDYEVVGRGGVAIGYRF